MREEPNPYAPPKHDGPAATHGDSALEAIRREHINAETNVKTIGFLLYLGAFSTIAGSVRGLALDPVNALVSLAIGGALAWGGYQLRSLDSRGRSAYMVVTAVGFLQTLLLDELSGLPGSIVAWTFLWPLILLAILWGPKASTVMTPHYRDVVIPGTPHVQRKTSVLVIVLGVLLLGVFVAAVVVAIRS